MISSDVSPCPVGLGCKFKGHRPYIVELLLLLVTALRTQANPHGDDKPFSRRTHMSMRAKDTTIRQASGAFTQHYRWRRASAHTVLFRQEQPKLPTVANC